MYNPLDKNYKKCEKVYNFDGIYTEGDSTEKIYYDSI